MEVLAECDEEKLTQLCRPMINAPANNESEYTSAQYNSGDWKSGGERETDRETETAEAERNRDREKWGGGKGGTSSIFSFFFTEKTTIASVAGGSEAQCCSGDLAVSRRTRSGAWLDSD